MPLEDKSLEWDLRELLRELERKIDAIGPTPLRHRMSEYVVQARTALKEWGKQ